MENLLLRWSFSFCFDCGEIQFVMDIEPPGSSSGSEGWEILRTYFLALDLSQLNTNTEPTAIVNSDPCLLDIN